MVVVKVEGEMDYKRNIVDIKDRNENESETNCIQKEDPRTHTKENETNETAQNNENETDICLHALPHANQVENESETYLEIPKKQTAEKDDIQDENENCFDWVVVFCSFISFTFLGMDFNGFSVFYPHLVEYFEASTASIGWCYSIQSFASSIAGVLNSYQIDRYGCRLPGVIGALIVTFGMAITAFAPNLPFIYIFYGIVTGYGVSLCHMTTMIVVQQRFNRHRALAAGLASMGYSAGGFLGPLVANLLMKHFNWRGSFLLLAAIFAHRIPLSLLYVTPQRLLLRQRASRKSSTDDKADGNDGFHLSGMKCVYAVMQYLKRTFDFSLLKEKTFALFIVVSCLYGFVIFGFMQHTVNRSLSIGLSRDQSVWAASLTSASAIIVRIPIAIVSNWNRVDRILLFAFGMFIDFLSVVLMLSLDGINSMIAASTVFGVGNGIVSCINTVVLVDIVGIKILARCLAIQYFMGGIFRLIASPFIGWIYDVTDDYDVAYSIIGICAFIASLLMISVYVIRRRRSNRERNSAAYTT